MGSMQQALAGMIVGTALGGVAIADDHKHPIDKCPPGSHTVTIEKSTNIEAKPGGVGGGHTSTEKREVCRDDADSRANKSADRKSSEL